MAHLYYQAKPPVVEAMQYLNNADAMIAWAPEVLSKDADRKLIMTVGEIVREVQPTTWVIAQVGYYDNVRDQFFQKTYEEVPIPT